MRLYNPTPPSEKKTFLRSFVPNASTTKPSDAGHALNKKSSRDLSPPKSHVKASKLEKLADPIPTMSTSTSTTGDEESDYVVALKKPKGPFHFDIQVVEEEKEQVMSGLPYMFHALDDQVSRNSFSTLSTRSLFHGDGHFLRGPSSVNLIDPNLLGRCASLHIDDRDNFYSQNKGNNKSIQHQALHSTLLTGLEKINSFDALKSSTNNGIPQLPFPSKNKTSNETARRTVGKSFSFPESSVRRSGLEHYGYKDEHSADETIVAAAPRVAGQSKVSHSMSLKKNIGDDPCTNTDDFVAVRARLRKGEGDQADNMKLSLFPRQCVPKALSEIQHEPTSKLGVFHSFPSTTQRHTFSKRKDTPWCSNNDATSPMMSYTNGVVACQSNPADKMPFQTISGDNQFLPMHSHHETAPSLTLAPIKMPKPIRVSGPVVTQDPTKDDTRRQAQRYEIDRRNSMELLGPLLEARYIREKAKGAGFVKKRKGKHIPSDDDMVNKARSKPRMVSERKMLDDKQKSTERTATTRGARKTLDEIGVFRSAQIPWQTHLNTSKRTIWTDIGLDQDVARIEEKHRKPVNSRMVGPTELSAATRMDLSALTVEEMKGILKGCSPGDNSNDCQRRVGNTRRVETFALSSELLDTDQIADNINIMLAMKKFSICADFLFAESRTIQQACREIRQSSRLPKVLGIILSLGNQCNRSVGHSEDLSAKAITVSSLTRLNHSRSVEGCWTLLQWSACVIKRQFPHLSNFSMDMPSLRPAGKIDIHELSRDLEKLENQLFVLRKIAVYQTNREESSLTSERSLDEEVDALRDTPVGQFVLDACVRMESLYTTINAAFEHCDSIVEYFGEDNGDDMTYKKILSMLREFCESFDQVDETIEANSPLS